MALSPKHVSVSVTDGLRGAAARAPGKFPSADRRFWPVAAFRPGVWLGTAPAASLAASLTVNCRGAAGLPQFLPRAP